MSAITDTIGDYLTRIRNANMAKHKVVEIPASKIKKRITEVLFEKGYILQYKFEPGSKGQEIIKIALKYDLLTQQPIIKKLLRVSRPGLRKYSPCTELPRVMNGLGIAIISTSKGVMTDKEARLQNIGGEVLCLIH